MSSKVVDERVVEMKFDNAKFEKDVAQSKASMEAFKKALNFSDSRKSLEEYQKTMKNTDASGLTGAVDQVKVKLSALNVMAMTMVQNITNSVLNSSKRIISALSFDSIKDGYNEYNLKMGSIQTIMMSTGESLKTVNDYLDELNTYSDRTIYSFSDMTQNIGKFTNAGVKLKDAVAAIKGVSNEAAISGANANEASRAMYNFAQALSAGYVKLIDWKSIENANMATIDFKQNLLDTAVALGTVKKQGDMYVSTTTNAQGKTSDAFNATKNWNDELQSQWMTNEVLIKTLSKYTDETTELGKKAYAAASEFKTFSQMWDAWKESAQSGWASIWQNVFGDFDEAKQLWKWVNALVGDYIVEVYAAKNATLASWKEGGGRLDLINAALNAFEDVVIVLKAVKDGFQDVFPPKTSEDLLKFTKNLKDVTASMKMSEKDAANLRSTAKGIASIFKVVSNILGAGLKSSFGFAGKIFKTTNTNLLELTGSLGESIYAWSENIEKAGVYTKIQKNLSSVLGSVADAFDFVVTLIKDFGNNSKLLKSFVDIFDTFTPKVSNLNSTLESASKSKSANAFVNLLKTIWSAITAFGSGAVDAITKFNEKIAKMFGSEDVFSVINKVLVSGGLVGINKLLKKFSNVVDDGAGIASQLKGILDDVRNCFKAYQDQLKAGTLLKIASAIGILTLSLIALASISDKDLIKGIAALGTIMLELSMTTKYITGLNSKFKGVTKTVVIMTGLSIAVLILSSAMTKLSKIPWSGIAKGLISVGALMAELSLFISYTKLDKKFKASAIGMIGIAASILILSSSINKLGSIDIAGLVKGIVTIGALLTELSVFMRFTGNAKKIIAIGVSMILLGVAIRSMTKSIIMLGNMSVEDLIKGVAGLCVALLGMAAALNAMPKHMVTIGTGLLIISAALGSITTAIGSLGSMSITDLVKGIVSLTAALLGIAATTRLMKSALSGAASLLIASVAIKSLAESLNLLGKMSVKSLVKSLGTLAAAITIIGVASIALSGAIPTMLGISAAFIAFGVSILTIGAGASLVGAGLNLIATGIAALGIAVATNVTSIVAGLTAIITGVLELIPTIGRKLGEGIVEFSKVIGEYTPELVTSLLKLLLGVVSGIGEYAPKIADAFIKFVISVIDVAADNMPELIKSVVNFFGQLCAGVLEAFQDVDVTMIEKNAKALTIITALVIALGYVTSLIPSAMAGVLGLGVVITELTAVLAAIGALNQIPGLKWLVDEGGDLLNSVGVAIGKFVGGIVGGIAEGALSTLPEIGATLSQFMTNVEPFLDGAAGVNKDSVKGATSIAKMILALTAANLIDQLTDWFTGGQSLSDFASELVPFGKAMKLFAAEVTGIDSKAVAASATAATALSELASNLPNSGGLLGKLVGENDIDDFGEKIVPFGKAMKEYASAVSGINTDAVVASATAAKSLTALADDIPSSDGIAQIFTGVKDLSSFGAQLVPFGKAMKDYASSISGIDNNAITASATAATSLSKLADGLPETDGLAQKFTGEKSLATFADQLAPFATAIVTYSNTISGIDNNAITASAAAASSLTSLMNDVPTSGGLMDWFTGTIDMQGFGKQIASFAKSFKEYYANVKGIDMSVVTPSVAVAESIAAFANNIKGTGGIKDLWNGTADLGTFGAQLVSFGSYFAEYVDEVKDVKSGNVAVIANQINSLVTAINTVNADTVNAVSSLSTTMKGIADITLEDVTNSFEQNKSSLEGVGRRALAWICNGLKETKNVKTPATTMANNFVKVIKSAVKDNKSDFETSFTDTIAKAMNSVNTDLAGYKTILYSTAQSIIQNGVVKGIKSKYTDVVNSGKYLAEGLLSGVKSKNLSLTDAGMSMAAAVNSGVKKKGKIHSPSKLMVENGKYMGLGLIKGVDGMLGALRESGIEAGKALDNGVREYLQIHSPGKKGEETSKFDILGRINGIRNEINSLYDTGKDAGKAVDDGVKEGSKDAGSTTGTTVANNVKKSSKKASTAFKKIASDAYITVKATTENAKKMISTVLTGMNANKVTGISSSILISYKKMYKAYSGSIEETTRKIYENSAQAKKDKKVLESHKKTLNELYKSQNKLQKSIKKTTDTAKKASLKKSLKEVNKAISSTKKQIKADTATINKNMSKAFGIKAKNNVLNFAKALYLDTDQYKTDVSNIKQHQKALNDLYKKKAQLENEAAKASSKSDKKSAAKNLKENAKEIKAAKKQLEKDQKDVAKHVKSTLKEYRDGIRDTLKDYMKISNVSLDTGINAFEEFSDSIDLSVSQLLKNMQSQVDGIKSLETNLNELAERGLSKGLVDKLRDMGPDAAGYIKVFRLMSTKELKQANKAFKEQTSMTKDTLLNNWKNTQEAAKKWKSGIIKLLNMGYDTNLVKEIQNMGIDSGMAYVNALLDAGKKGVPEINKMYKKTATISDSASNDIVAAWVKNGKKVTSNVAKGTLSTVKKSSKNTAKKVADTVKKEAEEPLSKAAKAIQTKITQATEALQEEYKKIESVSEELATTVKSNIESFLSITSLSMDTGISDLFSEFETEQWDYTLDMFIDNMQSQIDGVKYVANGLDELANLGFCDGFIDYLKNLGPQAAQYITEFRTATSTQVERTNEIFSEYNKLTKEKLLDSAKSNLEIVSTWSKNMQTLVSNNLNPEILKELAEQGPSGADMVAAYASMTPEEIKQVNQYYVDTMKMSDDVSKEISKSYKDKAKESTKSYYDSMIAGLQEQLASQTAKDKKTKKLVSVATKLGNTVTTAITASLGDKKSAAALTTAGESIATALSTGVTKKKTDVSNASKSLAKAASNSASKVDTKGASSGGASLGAALASGISSMKGTVCSAAQSLVDAANAILSTISAPDISSAASSGGSSKASTSAKSSTKASTTKTKASSTASSVKKTTSSGSLKSGISKASTQSITNIFNQTNNSPKAISSSEVYRNTKNLFSQAKGALK